LPWSILEELGVVVMLIALQQEWTAHERCGHADGKRRWPYAGLAHQGLDPDTDQVHLNFNAVALCAECVLSVQTFYLG